MLDLHERKGRFALRTHPTWQAHGFHSKWRDWHSPQELAARWDDIDEYLDRVIPAVRSQLKGRHLIEGRVHAALCSGVADEYRVINREASPSFHSAQVKTAICDGIAHSIRTSMENESRIEAW